MTSPTKNISDYVTEPGNAVTADIVATVDGDFVAATDYSAPGDLPTNIGRQLSSTVTPLMFVPTPDYVFGVGNDTAVLQAAIDYVSGIGGGAVQLAPGQTYNGNIVLKTGVVLVGQLYGIGYLPGSTPVTKARLVAWTAGDVISTPATEVIGVGVVGVNIQGLGPDVPGAGIHFKYVGLGLIKYVSTNSTGDEGILLDAQCAACTIDGILIVNAIRTRTRSADIGALDISGTDHFLSNIECGISGQEQGHVQSANLYCKALMVRASNCAFSGVFAELSDVGVCITGANNRFSNSRGDLNYGHGWQITGTNNTFSTCFGQNNSQDTNGLYDNFNISGARNVFSGCIVENIKVNKARWDFNDTLSSTNNQNRYVNCGDVSASAVSGAFSTNAFAGAGVSFPSGSTIALTQNSATPTVQGWTEYRTNNTMATSVTNFTGGVSGQHITIRCGDSNTTLVTTNPGLLLSNGGSLKIISGYEYAFVLDNARWRQVGAFADPPQVGADVGDAAKTLQARVDEPTQVWSSPLTVDRAVALSTTGAYNGAPFRIVRSATSTGAFNLNVGTGPLKALAVGQWCDVQYNGSAWILTAFGSL